MNLVAFWSSLPGTDRTAEFSKVPLSGLSAEAPATWAGSITTPNLPAGMSGSLRVTLLPSQVTPTPLAKAPAVVSFSIWAPVAVPSTR